MNREELMKLAEQAGAKFDPSWGIAYNCGNETFVRFASLVAAAERERCAMACEKAGEEICDESPYVSVGVQHCAWAIRDLE